MNIEREEQTVALTPECSASGELEGDFWTCSRRSIAKGLCEAHYMQDRRGRALSPIGSSIVRLRKPTRVVLYIESEDADILEGEARRKDTTMAALYRELVKIAVELLKRQNAARAAKK